MRYDALDLSLTFSLSCLFVFDSVLTGEGGAAALSLPGGFYVLHLSPHLTSVDTQGAHHGRGSRVAPDTVVRGPSSCRMMVEVPTIRQASSDPNFSGEALGRHVTAKEKFRLSMWSSLALQGNHLADGWGWKS